MIAGPPTVSEILSEGGKKVEEHQFRAECQQCRQPRPLSICQKQWELTALRYRCPECSDMLVLVTPLGEHPSEWPLKGYRFGDWVIRPAAQLIFRMGGRDLRFDELNQ